MLHSILRKGTGVGSSPVQVEVMGFGTVGYKSQLEWILEPGFPLHLINMATKLPTEDFNLGNLIMRSWSVEDIMPSRICRWDPDHVTVHYRTLEPEERILPKVRFLEVVADESPLDINGQLNKLRMLQPGWLDGEGVSYNTEDIDRLANDFHSKYPTDIPLLYIYPTPEGGISVEWRFGPYDITLEIDLSKYNAYWHCRDMVKKTTHDLDLNLDSYEEWTWFIERIQELRHHS